MELERQTYYHLIHLGVKSLLVDRMGHFNEDEYHQTLNVMTGKSSCFSMSDDELIGTVDNLRDEGYLEEVKSMIPKLTRSTSIS
ncbi:regulatory protein GemA [Vibrio intestinalis]|uniref:regulatory protein GemA n=1 Tax=Vibrio intestinalis TaxID=2933291 RepID=UPI0021A55C1E|nr:regulatory protein GemA [Vibrio intestinalis]